jgi:hypothetical protein
MPDHSAGKFTVDLDAVEPPDLNRQVSDARPAKPKHRKERSRSTVGNRGRQDAPQTRRYAFRRS